MCIGPMPILELAHRQNTYVCDLFDCALQWQLVQRLIIGFMHRGDSPHDQLTANKALPWQFGTRCWSTAC